MLEDKIKNVHRVLKEVFNSIDEVTFAAKCLVQWLRRISYLFKIL